MNLYAWLKLIHVFAVIVFLGNILASIYWMRRAESMRDPFVISFVVKGIMIADRLFTIPGVLVIVAGGFAAAIHGGIPLLKTGWICWSIVLFSLSGIVFSTKLAPLQRKIYQLSAASNEDSFDITLFRSYVKQWQRWVLVAGGAPVTATAMMVLKIPVWSGL